MRIEKNFPFQVSVEKLWDLLTNPAMTKQYMFGCEILSNWKIGDPVLWQGPNQEGKTITYVKGHVLEIEIGKQLKISMFDAQSDMEDIPSNYIYLTYNISGDSNSSTLHLIQDGYEDAANGKKRFEESNAGWDMLLPIMKKLVE